MTGRDVLVRGGRVLSTDRSNPTASELDVLISGGRIARIAEHVDAPHADVVDASGALVTPGLVDTHLHLWQTPLRGMTADLWAREYFHTVHPMSRYYTPEDMYWSTYGGAVELLSHGVTRVFDYCHSANSPEHADASLRALRDSGIRATYGFALFEREEAAYRDRAHRLDDLERLVASVAGDPLIDVALAIDHSYDADAVAKARELGIGISVHGNPVGLLQEFVDADALGPDVLWVHGNYASEQEISALASSGAHLALTPDIEMGMGKPVAVFDRAVRAGAPITLGVDVVSYACADLLVQMRLAYALHRTLDGMKERDRGHVPPMRDVDVPGVSTRDVVEWATVNGGAALDLGHGDHGLVEGAAADLILIGTEPFGLSMGDPAGHLVLQTTAADIRAVLVAGEVRYRPGDHIGVDAVRLSQQLAATRARLFQARKAHLGH
ncbi:MAG: amidohydrolase family protein [Microbacterium sp.]